MSGWPDLVALELLVAVADHGSLSAGARAVGVAQPNASRSIGRLERHLGVPLLHRSTRGSTLTDSGVLVVEWARGVMAAATDLVQGAQALSAGVGSLAVAASQTVAEHLLPRWLSGLRAAQPQVRVAVHVHNSSVVIDGVLDGRWDLGFVEGPQPPAGLHHLVVARDELILVVPPEHPWARRTTPVTGADLLATPLVTREAGSGTRTALDTALGRPATSALELPSNAAVRVNVQAGTAPAVLSRLAVADALAAGSLREVPTELDLHRRLRAVWSGPRRLQGPAAELVAQARAGG